MNRYFLMFCRFLLIAILMANFLSCKEEMPWEVTPDDPPTEDPVNNNKPQGGVNLRPLFEQYGLTASNQGARGTCGVFATTGMIEFERAHALKEVNRLSQEYLNWAADMAEGIRADGALLEHLMEGLALYGICEASYMPYEANYNPLLQPSAAAKENAAPRKGGKAVWIKHWAPGKDYVGWTSKHFDQVIKLLDDGHPVAVGTVWSKVFLNDGEIPMQDEDEVNWGGHGILFVGYQYDEKKAGGGYFIFRNSWGESFGDKGYGTMPFAFALKYANDAVALNY